VLAKLTRTARKIAAGDVNVEADIPQVSADELGILSQTFREMASSLQRVSLAAEAVAGGDLRSTHLSRGSQDGLGRAFEFMVDDLRRLVQAVITNASQITQSAQISAAARQIRFGFEVPGRQHRESGRVRDLGGGGISFESDIARTRGMPIAMSLDLERGRRSMPRGKSFRARSRNRPARALSALLSPRSPTTLAKRSSNTFSKRAAKRSSRADRASRRAPDGNNGARTQRATRERS